MFKEIKSIKICSSREFSGTVEPLSSGHLQRDGKWPLNKGLSQSSIKCGTKSLYLKTNTPGDL